MNDELLRCEGAVVWLAISLPRSVWLVDLWPVILRYSTTSAKAKQTPEYDCNVIRHICVGLLKMLQECCNSGILEMRSIVHSLRHTCHANPQVSRNASFNATFCLSVEQATDPTPLSSSSAAVIKSLEDTLGSCRCLAP